MIKDFVKFNKQLSCSFSSKFPNFVKETEPKAIMLDVIEQLIRQKKLKRILEVGGIDRPFLQKSQAYTYDGLDIEYNEKCHEIYDNFIVQSIEEKVSSQYDMIISFTLLEHVHNNTMAFKAIYEALNENGVTIHYLPSKYHPVSLILRLVGQKLQKKIISLLRPWARDESGYPAYYDKCSPKQMEQLLHKIGFHNIKILPSYRANDYFSFFVPFYVLITLYENLCKAFNLKSLCSGFVIIASKDINNTDIINIFQKSIISMDRID